MFSLRPRLWLCVPPFAACWADVVATLIGQGRHYWSGDYAHVTEWNPLARELLRLHPLAFVAAAAASSVLVAAGILVLNRGLAVVLSFLVTFCHTAAAAAWGVRMEQPLGLAAAVALLLVTERLVATSWNRSGNGSGSAAGLSRQHQPPPHLHRP